MRIKFIKAKETWPIRHKVLRPNQLLEDCDYPNDRNPDSFHLGAFESNKLIAIASFYGERNEQIVAWKQYRLRGFATLPEYQGKGVGNSLMKFGLEHLQNNKADVLWCNARTSASPFYEKHGFGVFDDIFEIEGIGLHQLLYYLFHG